MPEGSLSLPAKLYLLAWDPARDRVTGASHLHHLVRAGALTELAMSGLLTDDSGIATPTSDRRTGDTALDSLLELIEESRPRSWKKWVTSRAGVTLDAVREGLVAAGLLRTRRKRVFGVFPSTAYVVTDRALVGDLHERARSVLRSTGPVSEVSDEDAALVALATAGELRTVATGREARRHKKRIEELTERVGAAAPALRKVIKEVRTAMIVAATSAGSNGG
ncbi:GOLPH3/VPS74 family protein [Streptomyces tsukubensis]|uniref:GPP34 family phosphoprotein n=1 Tax=Streptomyces tsukubensis TaxID=83656 RepID=A0A1V4AEA0_9ACTN|nr:GPP34 family phosphoprotein [Streptomyces tsukubensis]OON81813.1 GPP34 family phosphoprotein [Streptomyces tsukubensis]